MRDLEDRIHTHPDTWLCCIYCERFFQARHVRVDHHGSRQRCAVCDCAGIGAALWPWDAFRTSDWKLRREDLDHGMLMPGALKLDVRYERTTPAHHYSERRRLQRIAAVARRRSRALRDRRR